MDWSVLEPLRNQLVPVPAAHLALVPHSSTNPTKHGISSTVGPTKGTFFLLVESKDQVLLVFSDFEKWLHKIKFSINRYTFGLDSVFIHNLIIYEEISFGYIFFLFASKHSKGSMFNSDYILGFLIRLGHFYIIILIGQAL